METRLATANQESVIYIGATPVPIWPLEEDAGETTPVPVGSADVPTPTPLPPLSFTYEKYESGALKLSFEAPAGWIVDESRSDEFVLINPDPSMDYAAKITLRKVPVYSAYNESQLTQAVREELTNIGVNGFVKFERSNTARRKFLNTDAIYGNYLGTTAEGAEAGGRVIMACLNSNLYTLHVSYPREYTKTYVDDVYDRIRYSIKLN